MAQRMLAQTFVPFDQAVPQTPLQNANARQGNVEPKLCLSVMGAFSKNFGVQGFVVEGLNSIEPFRIQLQNTLRAVSPNAAELTFRKGDPRISAEPVEPGEEPAQFLFQRRYNVLLFQILSAVCIMGHSAGLVAVHAATEDGRAALLSLMNYCEPHLLEELGVAHYLDILCNTVIPGEENP